MFRTIKVQKIERRPCNKPVYNLAVQDDESYIAKGVVCHNCRSILVPVAIGDTLNVEDYITGEEAGAAMDLVDPGFGGNITKLEDDGKSEHYHNHTE